MKQILFLLAIITMGSFPLFFVNAQSNALDIELNTNVESIPVGEPFQLNIDIARNSTDASLESATVAIPGIENFLQQGSSQSRKAQVINGVGTSTESTTLTLVGTKEGEHSLGPAQLTYTDAGGTEKTAQSEAVTITVMPASGALAIGNTKKQQLPTQNVSSTQHTATIPSSQEEKTLTDDTEGLPKWFFVVVVVALGGLMLYWWKQSQARSRAHTTKEQNTEQRNEKNAAEKLPEQTVVKESVTSQEVVESSEKEESKIETLILPKSDDPRQCVEVKNAIMMHIQQKYQIDTTALTTHEVIAAFHDKKIDDPSIEEGLLMCDNALFAHMPVDQERLSTIITSINHNH